MSYIKEIHIIYSENKIDNPKIYTYNEKDENLINLKINEEKVLSKEELEIKKEEIEVENNPDLTYAYIRSTISSIPPGVIKSSLNQDRPNYIKYIVSLKKEEEYNKELEKRKQQEELDKIKTKERTEQLMQLISEFQNGAISRDQFNEKVRKFV